MWAGAEGLRNAITAFAVPTPGCSSQGIGLIYYLRYRRYFASGMGGPAMAVGQAYGKGFQ